MNWFPILSSLVPLAKYQHHKRWGKSSQCGVFTALSPNLAQFGCLPRRDCVSYTYGIFHNKCKRPNKATWKISYIYTLKLSSIFGIGKKSDYFWAMVYIETGFCIFFSYDHAAPWDPPVCLLSVGVFVGLPVCQFVSPSVRPSVCQTFFTMFLSSFHHELSWVIAKWCIYKTWRSDFKGQGHKRLVWPVTGICGP